MRTTIHRYLLFLVVAALLAFAVSCSALRQAGWTAGGAAAGGAAGAALGGPLGAAVGAGAGAVASSTVSENDSLRTGATIGEEAYIKQIERLERALKDRPIVERPFIPTWIKWVGAAALCLWLVWLKGHHLWRFFNGGGFPALKGVVAPSWINRKKEAR